MVHRYSSTNSLTTCKNSRPILSERSDFHKLDNLSAGVHAFTICMLTWLSVEEILLPRLVNWFTNFRGLLLKVEMAFSCLKHEFCFICDDVVSKLCSSYLAWAGVFTRSAWSSEQSATIIVSAEYRLLLVLFMWNYCENHFVWRSYRLETESLDAVDTVCKLSHLIYIYIYIYMISDILLIHPSSFWTSVCIDQYM